MRDQLKLEFYRKLADKLILIQTGQMTLAQYTQEVTRKIIILEDEIATQNWALQQSFERQLEDSGVDPLPNEDR